MHVDERESHVGDLEVGLAQLVYGAPPQLSASVLGPYKGTHRLPRPDPDLPYELEGEVWSMLLIKTLDTGWFNINGPVSVGDILPVVKQEISSVNTRQYALLSESLSHYGQRAPIHVTEDKKRLIDGIHRIACADYLGWPTMLVSTDRRTWHEWDESEVGQEYHKLWRQRLGMTG